MKSLGPLAVKASALGFRSNQDGLPRARYRSRATLFSFRATWYLINASLVIAVLLVIYSLGWEYSTRRYLKGFSDAIVPATAPAEEKTEAILDWMAHGPARRKMNDDSRLENRDPTDTLNYDALLKVCGTATNAFINLIDSGGSESRRLLLVDANQKTNHVVAEVLEGDRWIIADPAYRVILRGTDGKPLTRQDLANPSVFDGATKTIRGYDPSYSYQYTLHIHLGHFPIVGRPLQSALDRLLPSWQDSTLMTLLVERSSFGAIVASVLLILFLLLLRVQFRWYAEMRLGVLYPRVRVQLYRVFTALFIKCASTRLLE